MKQTLWIAGRFPGLNEIINEARKPHWAPSAKQKKVHTERVEWLAKKGLHPVKSADFMFTWHEKDRKRDPDNIMGGQKFILDGLRKAKILTGDGWNQVITLNHKFIVSKPDGVMVEIIGE